MIAISDDELNKLHLLTLNMAEQFVHFCRQNNLICYLCGGGCIGAVRHKGWIPWDDDLDFFMPREDYEKAIIYWKQQMAHSRYKMEISDAEHIDGNLFFTIRDSATTYIKPYQENMNITQGIVLDVLPLDGYPDKWWNRKKQCFWALIYSLYCAQITPKNHGKIIETLAKIMLFLVPNKKKRYKIFSYAKQKMTKYSITKCKGITELCSGPGYMKNWYPKEVFEGSVDVPFENTVMPIPVGYDSYLKIAFGNYMMLPPKDKQVASHDVVFMDLENSYIKYKGERYLKHSDEEKKNE